MCEGSCPVISAQRPFQNSGHAHTQSHSARSNRETTVSGRGSIGGQDRTRTRDDVAANDAAVLLTLLVQGVAIRWALGARDFARRDEGLRLFDVQPRLMAAEGEETNWRVWLLGILLAAAGGRFLFLTERLLSGTRHCAAVVLKR